MIKIVLSGVPEPYRERQRAFQTGRGGAPITYSYKAGGTRQYQAWLRQAAQEAMDGQAPLDGPLSMTMVAFMPIPGSLRKAEKALAERELLPHAKRPDMTQLLKAAEDALSNVVWRDDSLVAEHRLAKRYSPRPRLEIEVKPLEPD
jgi:Holliday junction resolvase RusA-like endonuclease